MDQIENMREFEFIGTIEEYKGARLNTYIHNRLRCVYSDEISLESWTTLKEVLRYVFLSTQPVKVYGITTFRYSEEELMSAIPGLANAIVYFVKSKEAALHELNIIKRSSLALEKLKTLVIDCYAAEEGPNPM
jgi:hypothetical protein